MVTLGRTERESEQEKYLQETMAFGIQGSLALKHILILLGVYILIWEEHRQTFQAELHCGFGAPKGPKSVHIPRDLRCLVDLTALITDPTLFRDKNVRLPTA